MEKSNGVDPGTLDEVEGAEKVDGSRPVWPAAPVRVVLVERDESRESDIMRT